MPLDRGLSSGRGPHNRWVSASCQICHSYCGADLERGEHGEDQLLSRCYQSCFALAEKNKIRSIAFPAISTGAYGFPLERACHIALRVMIDHLTEREGDERMSVFAVCFSERAFQCYQEVFREL